MKACFMKFVSFTLVILMVLCFNTVNVFANYSPHTATTTVEDIPETQAVPVILAAITKKISASTTLSSVATRISSRAVSISLGTTTGMGALNRSVQAHIYLKGQLRPMIVTVNGRFDMTSQTFTYPKEVTRVLLFFSTVR